MITGCSGQVVATADADTAVTQALLSVELIAPAGERERAARTHASARFLRMPSSTDEGLASHLVGAALELPAIGQCASVAPFEEERGIPLGAFGPIDLVDVGVVTIEAGAAHAALAARAFPDVVDLVSGVVYTTRDADDSFPAPSLYRFDVTGSAQLPATRIEVVAPPLPEAVHIGEQPLGADPVDVPREALALRWDKGSGDDLVYVDLTSYEHARLVRVRCTFTDDGAALIPASALPDASTAGLALHRVHRQPVVGEGFDGGEVRFDLAITGTLRFELPASVEAFEEP